MDNSFTSQGTTQNGGGQPIRRRTHPFANTGRQKPRRWPLVLRFVKGAIHGDIIIPTILHGVFAAIIVYVDRNIDGNLSLPSSIMPSLSIVVGLMLVFRNQTSYERFWTGRNYLTTIGTSCRNLSRSFLTCSYVTSGPSARPNTPEEDADISQAVGMLIATLYTIKDHLRAEWGDLATSSITSTLTRSASGNSLFERMRLRRRSPSTMIRNASSRTEYERFLPGDMIDCEDRGLSLPLQLAFFLERFIQTGADRGWYHAPQASQMQVQLNTLMDAYGKMETIRLTPIPVAHMIHQKQVLALFGAVLPFAMAAELAWWSVPLVTFIIFTLYGIEAIGQQLEDPFGYDRNDVKMDAIVADARVELEVMLEEWNEKGAAGMFLRKGYRDDLL